MAAEEQSILLRLEAAGQKAPRVRLRSVDIDAPVLRESGRFEILGELARGGVGHVLMGRDVDLGRDVALKVLREGFCGNPELIQRFVDEAQIGGQLQHPGIVPVYELGLQDEERPFFAMKLVKGHTLAALLKERAEPRRRLLQVFELVCQTIAYAHARGVIHRDLKPSNVMVGAFGEVQVLDWGLAKVLARGGIADERPAPEIDVTRIATRRSTGEGSESIAGSVMGTPAYMPPEQALGEIDAMDERSDVFSLGAILCEILTGEPPYTGEDLLVQAAQARLDDALERLDACEANEDLVQLTKRCLEPRRTQRPRNARVLAATTHAYLAAVEQRAHRAAVEAAKARGRAEQARVEAADQRRALRLSLAVAASVFLAVVIGGGGFLLLDRAERERARKTHLAVSHAMKQAQQLRGEERWQEALVAAQQAEQVARADEVDAPTRARAARLLATVRDEESQADEVARRKRAEAVFVAELEEIRLRRSEHFDAETADAEYQAAFRARGIDPRVPAEAVARIAREFSFIAVDLAATLDEWAWLRRTKPSLAGRAWRPLLVVARRIDPDPWRDKLREAIVEGDVEMLRDAAEKAFELDLPVRSLSLLGSALWESGAAETAVSFLRQAQRRHPDDVLVNSYLAYYLGDGPTEEALRFHTAAIALSPRSPGLWLNLSACLNRAKRRGPGALEEALAAARRAIELKPDFAEAYVNVSSALQRLGRVDEAIEAARKAVRLKPDLYQAHANLGSALGAKGHLAEGLAACHEAIRLRPNDADGHANLGRLLFKKGCIDDAVDAYREAIRLGPTRRFHLNLGVLLCDHLQQYDAAIEEFRAAIRLGPDYARAHYDLGVALRKKGLLDQAIASWRDVIRIDPEYWQAHFNLAKTLGAKGKLDEAESSYRKALQLRPDDASIHCGLASVLAAQGRYEEALTTARRGREVCSRSGRPHPPPDCVDRYEWMVGLEARLLAILRGDAEPADVRECLGLLMICYHRQRYAASARFGAEALARGGGSADDRYNAACAAALAGCGAGEDAAELDEAERARWRAHALAWLRENLSAKPDRHTLQRWLEEKDLAGVRDTLARLPDAEQEQWRAFWKAVADALEDAE
ncbi:MAG: tetratricopeptide repeat protein [Planctomycetota bacterium]|jgi:serine/threonine-protein kinase